ncbi:MAG: 3-isopropylmalate dehydratase small subunit, partial [Gammaproteobacteria bacterium]
MAVPLLRNNIDTDSIIPSRDIRQVSKSGLGTSLFSNWRYLYDGDRRTGPNPEFVLNDPAYAGATILLAGENFGCGSSREQAVWALMDFHIRVIIAAGFGGIFYNNCFENGLLPVRTAQYIVEDLAKQVAE